MATVDDQKTFGQARLSYANPAEIDEFVTTLERYERGEITPDQWRAYRLVRGLVEGFKAMPVPKIEVRRRTIAIVPMAPETNRCLRLARRRACWRLRRPDSG